ncbi:MAG: SMP-30/gluconolactonase/LRE family protein [Rubrivivax sp.]|jgi:sugar lactone lactonase YvrE|nr:SMP-30/gluconolactonase/LRE family protein [Rubrivivax sp.]
MDIRCVAPSEDILGETPLWCEQTQCLLWIDIDRATLHRAHLAHLAGGRRDTFRFGARHLGGLALCHEPGRVVLALDTAVHVFDPGAGQLELLAEVEPAALGTRLNDGRCDASGNLWIGTMDNGLAAPAGSFYRIGADGSVARQFGDVIVSNTVALSPDQRTLYFSDTRRYLTWAFDVDTGSGTLANRRIFVDHRARRERPDGACVDSAGALWVAIFAGARVDRYTADGRLDRSIALPVTNPTCVCLGGPEYRTLFITTARKFLDAGTLEREPLAGSVLAVEVEVAGLPEKRFGVVGQCAT